MKRVCLSTVPITVYFCYTFVLSVVNGQQQFLEVPPIYLEVLPGEDVQLPCRVKDKSGTCGWLQDGILISRDADKYKWTSNHANDCTLLIKRASLDSDDGRYECQVSRTNFKFMDGLKSLPTRLLVIAKPKSPILQYEGGKSLDAVLTLKEREEIIIACTSNYGNPPAFIKWFIGNEEIEPLSEQKNISEMDKPKTWKARSLLRLYGRRENHGLPIRCVATHPSSESQANVESQLDIQYSPEVQIKLNPQPLTAAPVDLESILSLKCLAKANPAAEIKWFKNSMPLNDPTMSSLMYNTTQINDGDVQISELRFEPVKRQDAGMYSCKAVNIIGESAPASYSLDVQYEPMVKTNGDIANNSTLVQSVLLGSTVEPFECPEFDANPPAQYRWIHTRRRLTTMNNRQNKGSNRRLRLERITWSDQGEYRCMAFNTINGVKKEKYSEWHYTLIVSGPPEIQQTSEHASNHESVGWTGERVHRLKSRLCSQPPPKLVTWEWGSNQIRAGDNIHPKYEALPLEPITENGMMTSCYWAKLEIKDLQKEDARMYTLWVKSDKGEDSLRINLIVKDSTETRVIGAAVVIGLLLVFMLIFACVWSILRLRRRRYHQEVEEEGSIAADALYGNSASMDRQKSINSSTHVKAFAKKPSLDSDQSAYDYAHVMKQTRSMSPEALKVRRAPVVLQSPTIV